MVTVPRCRPLKSALRVQPGPRRSRLDQRISRERIAADRNGRQPEAYAWPSDRGVSPHYSLRQVYPRPVRVQTTRSSTRIAVRRARLRPGSLVRRREDQGCAVLPISAFSSCYLMNGFVRGSWYGVCGGVSQNSLWADPPHPKCGASCRRMECRSGRRSGGPWRTGPRSRPSAAHKTNRPGDAKGIGGTCGPPRRSSRCP